MMLIVIMNDLESGPGFIVPVALQAYGDIGHNKVQGLVNAKLFSDTLGARFSGEGAHGRSNGARRPFP